MEQNELMHYGIKTKSGRYPWGSGDRPYQRLESSKPRYRDTILITKKGRENFIKTHNAMKAGKLSDVTVSEEDRAMYAAVLANNYGLLGTCVGYMVNKVNAKRNKNEDLKNTNTNEPFTEGTKTVENALKNASSKESQTKVFEQLLTDRMTADPVNISSIVKNNNLSISLENRVDSNSKGYDSRLADGINNLYYRHNTDGSNSFIYDNGNYEFTTRGLTNDERKLYVRTAFSKNVSSSDEKKIWEIEKSRGLASQNEGVPSGITIEDLIKKK